MPFLGRQLPGLPNALAKCYLRVHLLVLSPFSPLANFSSFAERWLVGPAARLIPGRSLLNDFCSSL